MSKSAGQFRIKFWGTRGSIPVPGHGTVKYGGNTACVEVRCGDELVIIDAGSGIVGLGMELLKEMPVKASILFSHVHWDHIQGMPFFQPAYISGNEFKLYDKGNWGIKLEQALEWQMQSPSFPVTLEEAGARMDYVDVSDFSTFNVGDTEQITIRTAELRHTAKAFGFRIEYDGKSMVYATDNEGLPKPDKKLVDLARDADLLIHDAQYTSREYHGSNGHSKKNWGHSTPEAAVEIALAANVKKLVLFHHDPYHDDATIERMSESTAAILPNTIAASEGMVIEL